MTTPTLDTPNPSPPAARAGALPLALADRARTYRWYPRDLDDIAQLQKLAVAQGYPNNATAAIRYAIHLALQKAGTGTGR